ncbi:hypothetical protein BGW80DRAFT_1463448 [Lactifluus volemus]|nr:hypothetical protein BGW80DRAFT_1463448 [Lactifluus volemus]
MSPSLRKTISGAKEGEDTDDNTLMPKGLFPGIHRVLIVTVSLHPAPLVSLQASQAYYTVSHPTSTNHRPSSLPNFPVTPALSPPATVPLSLVPLQPPGILPPPP